MSVPRELPHEKGYVDTGFRVVDGVRVNTGHVEGIRAVQTDEVVEWWYRHEYVAKLLEFGFDQEAAVGLANKALSEHYLAAIYKVRSGN